MKTGLFFGSFNPIHQGHLIIGQFMLNQTDIEEMWYVVSPQNPLKKGMDMIEADDRLKMVQMATKGNQQFKACDIEFHMPKPSYTIHTLHELGEKHPDREFVIIMGSDNLQHLDKWKDHEELLLHYDIYAYNRDGFPGGEFAKNQKVRFMKGPMLNISATFIRGINRMGRSIRYLVTPEVEQYMLDLKEDE